MEKRKYKRTFVEKKCPACKGTGIREYEHGLIRLSCAKCKGTGKVRKEKRIYLDDSSKRAQPVTAGSPG